MKPSAFAVTTSAGSSMVIRDHAAAMEKATLYRGTLIALWSLPQVALLLEQMRDGGQTLQDCIEQLKEA